jgi:hypothetical protein
MWIAGENTPGHRTIDEFRGKRMQPVIAEVFHAVVEYLAAGKYVKLKNYYMDETKIEADGNKHKVVWAKRKEQYEKAVKEQVNELLKQIEAENEAVEAEYGERDLEEMGGRNEDVNRERLKKKIGELNERLRDKLQKREQTSTRQAMKKLESNNLPWLEKYEEQTKVLAGRNSYSKTDLHADERGSRSGKTLAKPAYNVQVGTQRQFIVGYSVHNKSSDPICLIEHLDGLKQLPKKVVADAA